MIGIYFTTRIYASIPNNEMQKTIGNILQLLRELHSIIEEKTMNEVAGLDLAGTRNKELDMQVAKLRSEIGTS